MEKWKYLNPAECMEAARRLRGRLTPEQMKRVTSSIENAILITADGCETLSKFPLAVDKV